MYTALLNLCQQANIIYDGNSDGCVVGCDNWDRTQSYFLG